MKRLNIEAAAKVRYCRARELVKVMRAYAKCLLQKLQKALCLDMDGAILIL